MRDDRVVAHQEEGKGVQLRIEWAGCQGRGMASTPEHERKMRRERGVRWVKWPRKSARNLSEILAVGGPGRSVSVNTPWG